MAGRKIPVVDDDDLDVVVRRSFANLADHIFDKVDPALSSFDDFSRRRNDHGDKRGTSEIEPDFVTSLVQFMLADGPPATRATQSPRERGNV